MSDKRKIEFLETTLKEILNINKDAMGTVGCIEFDLALEGELLVRWETAKKLAEDYLLSVEILKQIDIN